MDNDANADLIIAAPDLLKAAKRMLAMFENLCEGIPWGDTFGIDFAEMNEAPIELKRAIAKAEPTEARQ